MMCYIKTCLNSDDLLCRDCYCHKEKVVPETDKNEALKPAKTIDSSDVNSTNRYSCVLVTVIEAV